LKSGEQDSSSKEKMPIPEMEFQTLTEKKEKRRGSRKKAYRFNRSSRRLKEAVKS